MIIEKIKKFFASEYTKKALRIISCALPAIIIEILYIIVVNQTGIAKEDMRTAVFIHLIAVVSILISFIRRHVNTAVRWAAAVVSPAVSFFLLEYITHNPFDIDWDIILLNLALFYITTVFLAFLFGRTAVAVSFVAIVPVLFGLISYYTSLFRGAPLFPWDLASYGIAATVVGNYEINLTLKVVLIAALTVLLVQIAVKCNIKIKFSLKFIRPAAALISCAALFGAGAYLQTDRAISEFGLYPYLFTPNVLYERNGFTVSFLMNLRYTTVEKPYSYSTQGIKDLADGYDSDSSSDDGSEKPNVIVIMNESFADMSVLCDYETSEECLPFISSLSENTLKGNLHISVVGGNTPNSEFEFLTGLSMGYLPSGSIAYQQFIKKESPTLASQFSDIGYRTVAVHPYYETGWKRNEIYPMFGFDEMYFIDDFEDPDMLRSYISDSEMYEKIIDLYSESEEPLFLFGVTMQNHGGYTGEYSNFIPYITVDGLENNESVSTYMTLIRESDRAFENLVNYFSDTDEKTVILMFGDHQPNDSVARPLMNLSGMVYNSNDVESSEPRYITPYVLWANYDIEYDSPGDISANYLSSVLTDVCGIPQTSSQKYLLDLMREYPVINSRCFINSSGDISPISEYEDNRRLMEYSALQYNYLFDRSNMPELFWSLKP